MIEQSPTPQLSRSPGALAGARAVPLAGALPAALPNVAQVTIELLLASPQHRYEGRPANGPLEQTARELFDTVELRAGLGIVGDRYFGARAHRTASVTVFAAESLEHVARTLGLEATPDAADTRRNIVLRGVDVDALRGFDFTLDSGAGPVLLRAHRAANPCAWMDVVIAPGAHGAMLGRGGIRCEPLSNGTLSLGPAVLRTAAPLPAPALF